MRKEGKRDRRERKRKRERRKKEKEREKEIEKERKRERDREKEKKEEGEEGGKTWMTWPKRRSTYCPLNEAPREHAMREEKRRTHKRRMTIRKKKKNNNNKGVENKTKNRSKIPKLSDVREIFNLTTKKRSNLSIRSLILVFCCKVCLVFPKNSQSNFSS